MGLILVDPATELPVTLAELKLNCGVEDSSFDSLLTINLKGALAHVERVLDRALGAQTWLLAQDDFTDVITLPVGPVLAISTGGFTYLDETGTEQVVPDAAYTLDLVSNPQRVVLNEGQDWPSDNGDFVNAVQIQFSAGYTAATLPADLKQAILLLAAHWFENRAAVAGGTVVNEVPLGFDALLWPHRRIRI